jgi:hypothetical protein
MPINYKPFHNQIKKAECTDYFKDCFENALAQWIVQSLKLTSLFTGEKFPFENVVLHDGCSFAIHSGLKEVFPGRFTKHSPAAIELHVTMDLLTYSIDYFALTADTLSERLHTPAPEKINKDRLRAAATDIVVEQARSISCTLYRKYIHTAVGGLHRHMS